MQRWIGLVELRQVYKCDICGNIVEVVGAGGGTLVCCGKPMEFQQEKALDIGNEKHVPVIEKTPLGYKVKVGSVAHPMEEAHYIQWIELVADGISMKKFLKPGNPPEAEFNTTATTVSAREYCNLHGLWKSK